MRNKSSSYGELLLKKAADNLWIKLGQARLSLGQNVNNWQVTHSPKNSMVSYAPRLPELYTGLVHMIFVQINRLNSELIPIVHTTNNYYYINK